MVANTAFAFVLAGVALRLQTSTTAYAKFVKRACAAAVIGFGLITLAEYLFGADFYIDGLLAWLTIARASQHVVSPNRMSPHTAFNFVIVGCALLSANRKTPGGAAAAAAVHPAQLLALVSASISLFAFVGYVYGVAALYRISPQTGMALHTATAFLLLSAGVMLIHPREGLMKLLTSNGLGGVVARRLLAATLIIPLLFGWLSVLGEQAQLYDAAIASSLLVVSIIVAFSALVWSGANALERIDFKRREAEAGRAQLLQRIVSAQEEERRRLARELHDQMGQHLAALVLQLELHQSEVDFRSIHSNQNPNDKNVNSKNADKASDEHLRQAFALTEKLMQEAHTLAWSLRPPELDHFGLQAALARYVEQWERRSSVAVDFVSSGFEDKRLPPEIEIVAYRVVQEALTNVLKHAFANNVSLILERITHKLLIVVEDDGRGFDAEAFADYSGQSLGILGMRERVESVCGTLELESNPLIGTTLVVRIPLPKKSEVKELQTKEPDV